MHALPRLCLSFALVWALSLPSLASAEDDVCVCTSVTADWPSLTDPVGWSCSGGSGTPDPADTFVISTGCHRRVTGALAQTGDACLRVVSSGSLEIDVRDNGDEEVRVTLGSGEAASCTNDPDLGPLGLHVDALSDLIVRGGWREFDTATPALQSTPSAVPFGDLYPCSDALGGAPPDCDEDGALQTVRHRYASVAPGGDPNQIDRWREPFDEIRPGDVLVFVDSDPNDVHASTDHLAMYEIETAGSDVDGVALVFDTHQGEEVYSRYPLARREVKATTLVASVSIGDRVLFVDGSFIDAGGPGFGDDDEPIGHWVRCAGDPGAPIADFENAWTIQHAIDGNPANAAVPDTLVLADRRGIGSPCAQGEALIVDMGGWRRGDEMAVMVPVRFDSATSSPSDSNVLIEGDTTISEAVFEATHRVSFRYTTQFFQSVDWGGYVWFKDLVGFDPCGDPGVCAVRRSQSAKVGFEDLPAGSDIHHVLITGGMTHPGANDDAFHGIGVQGGPGVHYRDVMARHLEDDALLMRNSKAGTQSGQTQNRVPPEGFRISRFRCQYRSDFGASQDCIQLVASVVNGSAFDIESVNGTTGSGPIGHTVGDDLPDPSVSMTVDGLFSMGNEGGWAFSADLEARDVTWIGGTLTGRVGSLTGAVLRDWHVGTGSMYMNADFSGTWRDVLVENFEFTQSRRGYFLCTPRAGCARTLPQVDALFENVAWVNGGRDEPCTGCAMLEADNPNDPSTYTFRDNTWLWTEDCGSSGPIGRKCNVRWFMSRFPGGALDPNSVVLANARISGLDNSASANPAVFNMSQAEIDSIDDEGQPVCITPADGNTLPDPNAGPVCGASAAAGVTTYRLIHAWRRLVPENLGNLDAPDADLDGIPDAADNCPFAANGPQTDADADGTGDACECGDADGDGTVNTSDARVIQLCVVGAVPCPALCDVTGEGVCNTSDARVVQLHVVGVVQEDEFLCAQRGTATASASESAAFAAAVPGDDPGPPHPDDDPPPGAGASPAQIPLSGPALRVILAGLLAAALFLTLRASRPRQP